MAFQLPNFLTADTGTPDYSGLADIFKNYYEGKQLPKEDLINSIKAEYARPTAEQALLASKLSNRGSELSNRGSELSNRSAELKIQQFVRELAQQKAFERQLTQALTGNAANAGNAGNIQPPVISQDRSQAVAQALSQMQQQNSGNQPQNQNLPVNPRNMMPSASGLNVNNGMAVNPASSLGVGVAPASPVMQQPPIASTEPHEIVLDKGEPHLAGVDQMWESSPLYRSFLEKKGYKKEVKRERNNKTGEEIIYTKYPSGMMTKKIIAPQITTNDFDGDIPLTKPVLNAAVKQVRGTDAVIPYIDEMIAMGGATLDKNGDLVTDKNGNVIQKNNKLPSTSIPPFTWTDAHAGYKRIVNNALEKYMAASGFVSTDKSTMKVDEIMSRSFGESNQHYLKELAKERKNMLKGRKQNVDMITKGMKRFPDFGSESSGKTEYSSNDWEAS